MTSRPVRILVVAGDEPLAAVLCDALRTRGHRAVAGAGVAEAADRLAESEFDVAVLDLGLPGAGALDLVERIRREAPTTESVVLVPPHAVPVALEALRRGASDFTTTPPHPDVLETLVLKATEKARLRADNALLRASLAAGRSLLPPLFAEDAAMRDLLAALERAASSDLPAIFQGEAGTGKTLLARALHGRSRHAALPFVEVDCTDEEALARDVFGAAGAGEGGERRLLALAGGGVLFLRQVSALPPALQPRLLRVLETSELVGPGPTRRPRLDLRLLASTRRSLKAEAQEGRFRSDLHERLNGLTLRVPPLRERRRDMPLLAAEVLRRLGARQEISAAALSAMAGYHWPGNVREMEIVVEHAVMLCPGDTIEPRHLALGQSDDVSSRAALLRTDLTLAEMEREYVRAVLRQNGGHRGRTARALGVDPKTLYNKLGPARARKRGPRE